MLQQRWQRSCQTINYWCINRWGLQPLTEAEQARNVALCLGTGTGANLLANIQHIKMIREVYTSSHTTFQLSGFDERVLQILQSITDVFQQTSASKSQEKRQTSSKRSRRPGKKIYCWVPVLKVRAGASIAEVCPTSSATVCFPTGPLCW